MEEINSLIFRGCKLARDLETNFHNLANQPNILLKSCDEIVRVFSAARDGLNAQGGSTSYGQSSTQEPQMSGLDKGLHELLIRYMAGMGGGVESRELGLEVVGGDVEGFRAGGGELQAMDVADSSRGTSLQRPRRRTNDGERRTVMVAAPRMGNTDIPPEDGYTWRKYGQKEILGSRFPRGYYRCTHQKLYQCPAKKLVQRLDNDPYTFEVTYRGDHICHMSATAPSVPLSISPENIMSQQATIHSPPPPSSSNIISGWLSMSSGGSSMSGSGGAGPSTVRYGREVDYQLPVADLADAMFNSGSSSNNSIDLIFSPVEDKWGTGGDKKSS